MLARKIVTKLFITRQTNKAMGFIACHFGLVFFPAKHLIRFVTTFCVSAFVALIVACATNAPPLTPSVSLATPASTTIAQADSLPTHRPRQHSGEHIPELGNPIDASHFVDSFPNHSQTLTQSPARVGINFDRALASASQISIERDGKKVEAGALEFDPRKIFISVALPPNQGDGLYLVKYRACFADDTCSDGRVGFRVDSARVKNFLDLTHEKNVSIHLRKVKYQPNEIIVARGTTVTWVNDDPVDHFVNSDPHPSHNAHPKFNSLDIPPTETFSYTFDEIGEYTFHCSAHVPQNMFGTIIVRAVAQ